MLLGDLIFLAIYNGKLIGEQNVLDKVFSNVLKYNFTVQTQKRNNHMGSSNNGHETAVLLVIRKYLVYIMR